MNVIPLLQVGPALGEGEPGAKKKAKQKHKQKKHKSDLKYMSEGELALGADQEKTDKKHKRFLRELKCQGNTEFGIKKVSCNCSKSLKITLTINPARVMKEFDLQ